jgi:hypothetical protein
MYIIKVERPGYPFPVQYLKCEAEDEGWELTKDIDKATEFSDFAAAKTIRFILISYFDQPTFFEISVLKKKISHYYINVTNEGVGNGDLKGSADPTRKTTATS